MIRIVAVVWASVFLLACGRAPAQDSSMVVGSDPELVGAAEAILPDLARRSGLELREPVRVERRSRAQLEGYLRFKLDQELSTERADRVQRAYRMLGLLPDDVDLRDVLLSVYLEQVAGFYDPDSTALFVMDDQPVQALEALLTHELVHAIQDQAIDLDAITARERGNDRQLAAQAAVEGQATLVMLEQAAARVQGGEVDITALPDFSRAVRPALRSMTAQFPALASAPALLQESLLFPYLEGVGFVQALWVAREGRPVPFGENLPQSTEQVLHPQRFLRHDDGPTDVLLDAGPGELYRNTLGQLELSVLLSEHLGADAARLARGWDGDTFVLADGPGGDALAWAVVWDTEEARNAFVGAFSAAVPGLDPGGSLAAVEVQGRPVSLLLLGGAEAVDVSLAEPAP